MAAHAFTIRGVRAILLAAEIGALIYLVGLPAAGFVALLPPVYGDIEVGNVHLLVAAGLVAGMRGHALGWAFVLLSKVTPGVALLWYAGRREWRNLAWTLAVMAALVTASFVIAPHLWFDWIALLAESSTMDNPYPQVLILDAPLVLRLAVAAGIVGFAAWRLWAWLLPVAVLMAMPAMWIASAAVLVAMWPLYRNRKTAINVNGEAA